MTRWGEALLTLYSATARAIRGHRLRFTILASDSGDLTLLILRDRGGHTYQQRHTWPGVTCYAEDFEKAISGPIGRMIEALERPEAVA